MSKNVVTANKALVAKHGIEILKIAEKNNSKIAFEAAVAGGVPVIKVLKEFLLSILVARYGEHGKPNKNIFLCPEAEYGSTKRWPKDYWITLAKYFKKKNFNVYFIGKDKISASEYESITDNVSIVSLIGKTDLDHAAHILSFADLVVANDSGLMHLAASLDVNLISIYGSSSPFYTPPLMKDNHGEVLYRQIECSPCFKKICPLPGDENLKCLKNISPEEVSIKSKIYLD